VSQQSKQLGPHTTRILFVLLLVITACAGPDSPRAPRGDVSHSPRSLSGNAGTRALTPDGDIAGLLLASSFELPICGDYWRPGPGCEFGGQGGVDAGPYRPRTGASAARIPRDASQHMGVIAVVPLRAGRAFVGVAHRIPSIPKGAIPSEPGYIQLEQLSPTDGVLHGWPVEVRLYPDRRLGLALFEARNVVLSDWRVPVDGWFYVVVKVANGSPALQRMWVYDSQDRLVDMISASLVTQVSWPHQTRAAQKIGGTTATLVPLYSYADDWYISTQLRGPLRIGRNGLPLSS
jgi:hypothetical protein